MRPGFTRSITDCIPPTDRLERVAICWIASAVRDDADRVPPSVVLMRRP